MHDATKSKHSDSRGFTLIELMIAMIILLVTLGILTVIMSGMNRQFRDQRPRVEAVNNAQAAADTIARLIRMSGNRPTTCAAAFTVGNPTPSVAGTGGYYSQLRLQSDWNPADCDLDDAEEDVTLSVSNGVLYLDSAQAVPFVNGIAAIRFQFFNSGNTLMNASTAALNPATQPANIAYIRFEIQTVATDGTSTTITSGASIR